MSKESSDRSADTVSARLRAIPHVTPRGARLELVNKSIGRYRLINFLGEGGMGTVYLAEQHDPVHRIVALKLMRSTLAGPAAEARFNAERQALARLSHPNVAAMYDAGATDEGFPFFVMERVEGMTLEKYCDEHRLTVRERIVLLIQICKGVQHAHQKGILHRDLKPSNVLVADVEGRAVPKIIDFGIAKAIDQPLLDTTAVLTAHGVIGTPAYMSPEALNGDDLDTRTDVYAIGVMLYEMMTDVRPHKTENLPLGAVIKSIAERDAPLPRDLFRAADEITRQKIATARNENERSLDALLGGDLGWIARRATAREREERYGSAADLAADLERYLNDEAIVARPPTMRYRATKFARRHRAAVLAGVVVTLTIIAGIAGTTIGMLRAQRARAEAEAVSKFLTDLLDSASPWQRKNETTVRQLLVEAADKITHQMNEQPAARAQLLATIGESQFHLGHLDSAERLLREAIRLRTQIDGPDSPSVAAIENNLGLVRKHQGHLADAERWLRSSIAIREKTYGHVNHKVARGLFDLASILAARHENIEAEVAFRESLALRERLFAEGEKEVDASTVALTMNGLGKHLMTTGKLHEAEGLMRRGLEMRRRANDRGYAYALSLLDLGKVVAMQGRLAEAEALDRMGIDALRPFVEPNDQRITDAEAQLAEVMRAR